ncbi:MAG: glycosyltransferase family A protein [Lentisphaeria bacterium]|jgi:glycosyltransferase involved in cell wall biosynthesis|nr:glycosyltransferase family A protein [Lentisphaeria bacterium]MDP7743587.1 glycosyltransferase family A protein [Lentisphaeria bacterium]
MAVTNTESQPVPGGRKDVAVIYPTRNRPEMLMQSLAALLQNTVLPAEIVVVDQSDDDATKVALEQFGNPLVRHVPSDLRGLSNSRNVGIEASTGALIGFLDDDCIPAPDWVASALRAAGDFPQSQILIGEVYDEINEISGAALAGLTPRIVTLQGRNDPWIVGPTGGNSFFRRQVFEAVGVFDPVLGQGAEFPGAEDADMVYRVLKCGLEVTYTDAIRVHHLDWRNDEANINNTYNYGLGVGAMFAKHAAAGDRYPKRYIFARRFMIKFLAAPCYLLLARRVAYRRSVNWLRGIREGFSGWEKMNEP